MLTMLRLTRSRQIVICGCLVLATLLITLRYTNTPLVVKPRAEPRVLPAVQDVDHLIGMFRRRPNIKEVTKNSDFSLRMMTTSWSKSTGRKMSKTSGIRSTTKTPPLEDKTTPIPTSSPKYTTAKTLTTTTASNTTTTVIQSYTTKSLQGTTRLKESTGGKLSSGITSSKNASTVTDLKFVLLNARVKMIRNFRSMELSQKDRTVMLDLLEKLWEVKRQQNFTMFLYGGTLLGSWRHHGFVPYDDDVDIASPKEIYEPLLKALNQIGPKYKAVRAGSRIKFFSNESTHQTPFSWKWPYMDLQFYEGDDNYIWDFAREFSSWKYAKNDTFPLRMRPYEGKWYETPRKPDNFLKTYYGDLDICKTGWYSHMRESGQKIYQIECKYLRGVYPFVTERKTESGQDVEVLKLGRKLIKEEIIPR